MIRRLLPLFLCLAATAYGVETLLIDSNTRNVINLGAVNFSTSQLKVNGIAVVGGGGGGGGGGGTIDNVRLNLPTALFVSPVDYTISGGLAEGTAALAQQSAGTVFANLTGSNATPIFVTLSALKSSLAINNVDNTSDANKPISTATQAALDTLTGNVATNTSDIAALTTTVSGKADTTTVNTALAAKASTTYVDTQDSTKQNSWGTPGTNGYIAAGNTDGSLFWVNPVTLGTTSQSYTDGVENSTTTFDSNDANFVAGDAGKTITGDNIPVGTTIAAVVDENTITLSQAATASGGSKNFTILNRLEVGGTGTVTSVASGNLSLPGASPAPTFFTSSVTSPSSSATIAYSLTNAAANTLFGNATGLSGAPAYMDATTARGVLGGSTLGQSVFTITNPNGVTFPRFNANNTVTARIASDFRSDIGAGTVSSVGVTNNTGGPVGVLFGLSVTNSSTTASLVFDPASAGANTFYGNGTSGSATPTFMSATTARTALGGTTVGQNLFTLANPSAVTYPRISATNTVTAATAATMLSDIGAASSTDPRFPVAVTGIRKGNGSIGSPPVQQADTAAIANVDYDKNAEASGALTGDSAGTWTAGATVWRQTAALTANRNGTLPAANSYAPGTIITYVDSFTTGNFGRSFSRAGSDTLNGGSTAIIPFIAGARGFNGSKVAQFETNGVDAWRTLGIGVVDHVEDGTNALKSFTFDASLQDGVTPGIVTAPPSQSYTFNSTDSGTAGVLTNADAGTFTKRQISPSELLPIAWEIGTAGNDIAGNISTVNDSPAGSTDQVIIVGRLTGTYTIKMPNASNYQPWQAVVLTDNSGTAGTSHQVTVTSTNGSDTFSGASSFIFDEPNGRRVLTSDGAGNWNVATVKTTIQPYTVITPSGNVFTISGNTSAVRHNAHINLLNSANSFAVTNPYDGMDIDLTIVQPASGAAGTLSLPIGSRVGASGAGLVTLSTTNGRIDTLHGRYNGQLAAFLWDPPILNYSTSATPTAPSGAATSGITASKVVLTWTDNSTTEDGFSIDRAPGLTGTVWSNLGTVAAGVTTYTDNSVSPNTDYNFRVRAYNSGGFSNASAASAHTSTSGGVSADLWEVHANEGSGSNSASALVGPAASLLYATDWTSSTQGGGSASPAAFNFVTGMPVTSGTVTPTGGTGAISYTYRVYAYKTTPAGVHNFGTNLTTATGVATPNGTTFNRITWTAVTGANYYTIYRTVNGTGSTLTTIGQIGGGSTFTATTFDDTGIAATGSIPSQGATDIHSANATGTPIDYTLGGTVPGNILSVSFWIKSSLPAASGSNYNIINGGANTFRIQVSTAASKIVVTYPRTTGTETATITDTAISDNAWHHVVVIMDNSTATQNANQIQVYFDGTAQTVTYTLTGTVAKVFTASSPIIGELLFTGAIDDVRIYSFALSGAQVTSLFTGNAQ